MKKITKLFNFDIKSIDEANRQVTFCFSDNQEDRMGEIVDQASWDVNNYMQNPIILFGHDPSAPENVLGQGVSLQLNRNGKSYVTAQFDEAEVNPKADMVFRQVIKRTLRCVSAGFINHTFEIEDDKPHLKDNELLEISIVPIPANPRAFALGLRDGSITRKDGMYLAESMKKELEFVEAQLKQQEKTGEVKEKDMEEVTAALTQLTGIVGKIAESQAALTESVAAITAAKAEETDAEKAAREAEEAKATEEAKAQADKEAADKKAAEEAEAAKLAKGGENDQPGADEIDVDADLTDEQLAEAEAALQEALAAA